MSFSCIRYHLGDKPASELEYEVIKFLAEMNFELKILQELADVRKR